MKIKELFLVMCGIALLLLVSCQDTIDLSSDSAKDGEQIANLMARKANSRSSSINEPGTVVVGQEGTATLTSMPSVVAPSPTATPGACTMYTDGNKTVYSGPGTGYSIVGQLETGREYLVTGMYYRNDFPTWWRIDYEGAEGWVASLGAFTNFMPGASCSPPVELIDINPPPVATPSPTPQMQPGACYIAPVGETANLQVYAGPAYSHPVIGTTQPRQYYLATGQLPLELPDRLIQIDFNGATGWVDASHYMFGGDGCWPIPTLTAWPTPIVTSTPSPFPTLIPTSTLSSEINPDQVAYVSSVVGSTAQIVGDLPTADGKTTTAAAIRVDFGPLEVGPYDGVRMLTVLVQCTGVNPQNLRWGYYGSEADIECGRSIETGISQGANIVIFGLAVPSDGMTAAHYTITVMVNAP